MNSRKQRDTENECTDKSPEPDEQWKGMVNNPDIEAAFDAEVAAEERRLGRALTGHERSKIATKYAG